MHTATIEAYRKVCIGDFADADDLFERGLACTATGSARQLRKLLTLDNLRLHRGGSEGAYGFQNRSPFISFIAPTLNWQLAHGSLQREGLLPDNFVMDLDYEEGTLRSEYTTGFEMALGVRMADEEHSAVFRALLDVPVADPLSALGNPDLPVDTRFIWGDERRQMGDLDSADYDYEQEVSAQLFVPPERLVEMWVLREGSPAMRARASVDHMLAGYPLPVDVIDHRRRDPSPGLLVGPRGGYGVEYCCTHGSRGGQYEMVDDARPPGREQVSQLPLSLVHAESGLPPEPGQPVDLRWHGGTRVVGEDGLPYRIIGIQQLAADLVRIHLLRVVV